MNRKALLPWIVAAVFLAFGLYVVLRSAGRLEPAYHIGQVAVLKGEAFELNLQFYSWPPYLGDAEVRGIVGTGTEILDVVQSEYNRLSPMAVRSRLTMRVGANAVGVCSITGIRARIGGRDRLIPVGRIEIHSLDQAAVLNRRSWLIDAKMSTSGAQPFTVTAPMPDDENVVGLEPPLDGAQVAISNRSVQGECLYSTWTVQFQDWMWDSYCYVIYRPIVISDAKDGGQSQRSLGPLLEFGLEPSPRR